ncbi:methylated-DNA--[protein]-cysteine S-methyltransferase [Ornithinibacillus sp. 4-3]|uniref:Methylated-DNA--protein-cysteine methyltransferase n=1 Tax=Ornithinibacillus sp. 4-3 TaxID=3231488 RepID=A0AB39HQV6_9BACI
MSETIIYYEEMDSPIGPLLLMVHDEKAIRIDFGRLTDVKERIEKWLNRYFPNAVFVCEPKKLQHIKQQLEAYFAKQQTAFEFDYQFYGTSFQKQVWEALFTVPYGETKAYKDIAIAVNNPKAVRAIGGAVNKNPMSIFSPCHRIIGMNGKLVGYGGGLDKKKYLLKLENIL